MYGFVSGIVLWNFTCVISGVYLFALNGATPSPHSEHVTNAP